MSFPRKRVPLLGVAIFYSTPQTCFGNEFGFLDNDLLGLDSDLMGSNDGIAIEKIEAMEAGQLVEEKAGGNGVGSHIVNMFFEIVIGFILFIAGFPLLWHNEALYAKRNALISKGKQICHAEVDNPGTSTGGDSSGGYPLVHVHGEVHIPDARLGLKDAYFGGANDTGIRSLEKCVHVKRTVKMYQWTKVTKKDKNDKETTTIEGGFWEDYYESPDEKHQNPPKAAFFLKTEDRYCEWVFLKSKGTRGNGFRMPKSMLKEIGGSDEVVFTSPVSAGGKTWTPSKDGKALTYRVPRKDQKGSTSESGDEEESFQVGDMKVEFETLTLNECSVIALEGPRSTFAPFRYEHLRSIKEKGDYQQVMLDDRELQLMDDAEKGIERPKQFSGCDPCCGLWTCCGNMLQGNIELFDCFTEDLNYKDCWEAVEKKNSQDHMARQFFGFLCFVIGMMLMLGWFPKVLGLFPMMGSTLKMIGVSLTLVVSIIIAIPLTLLTISLAWLAYRPLKAFFLLFLVAAMVAADIYLNEGGLIGINGDDINAIASK